MTLLCCMVSQRNEPLTVLVPCKFLHIPVSSMVQDDTTDRCIPIFKHQDQDKFLNMLHVALQIRDDMLSQPRPTGIDISENRVIDSIPNSLYMFLNLLKVASLCWSIEMMRRVMKIRLQPSDNLDFLVLHKT